jgi:endo-1,4-beta-mannosidase
LINNTTPIPFYNRDYVTSIDYVNNRAIVGGYTFGSNCNNCIPTSTFNHDATGNTCDYWVMCLNDSANMIWQKCFGGSGNDYCTDVMLSKDG